MKFKIGDMKSKSIVNGIFITGLLYFAITVLYFLSGFLISPGISSESLLGQLYTYMDLIKLISSLVLGLILFKLVCELLYKLVKAAEIIIEKNDK